MKVLIAVHGFPPTHSAGAEQAAERIASWLVSNHHETHVFALEKYDSQSVETETDYYKGVVCYRLSYNVQDAGYGSNLRYDNPLVGSHFRDILEQGDFDIVHIVSGYLLGGQVVQIAHELGLPVVITLTEYWFLCSRLNLLQVDGVICSGPNPIDKCAMCVMEEKRRYRMIRQYFPGFSNMLWHFIRQGSDFKDHHDSISRRQVLLKTALEDADLVISPSHFLIGKHAEFGFNTDHWKMIRHGIGDPGRNRSVMPNKQTLPLRAGYIGQIKHHKGVDLIVEAVRRLLEEGREISLDIWGHLKNPTAYIQGLQNNTSHFPDIRWQGGFQGDQLWDVLDSIDVLVVPSRWYENCPTVILEAYKAKTPVIATDLGGMSELIEHGKSGLLFALNDVDDLTAKLTDLLDDPELLGFLRQGIPYIKTGDEEVAEIYKQYEEVLLAHDKRNIM